MSEEQLQHHVDALIARHAADVAAIMSAAEGARNALNGSASELRALSGSNGSLPTTLGGLPVDDLPPYVPPPSAHAENALIPDTPLVDAPVGAPAFDDAPLWQN